MILRTKIWYDSAGVFLKDVSIFNACDKFTGISIFSDELTNVLSEEAIEEDRWELDDNDCYTGEFDNEFICAFVGLKDEQSIEIYSNDIVVNKQNDIFLIEYSTTELAFLFRSLKTNNKLAFFAFSDKDKPFRIIGHKFDGKNLFKPK